MKPSNFCTYPWSSIFTNAESEIIAYNIMKILKRTGNTWRTLSWEEYVEERKKDFETDKGGGFNDWKEKPYFEKVSEYTTSEEKAREFCEDWKELK